MISAGILPLMKNKAEAREALVRETAAKLGINCLVGFTHLTEQYGGYGVSCAILANTGLSPRADEAARPRFIVCVLPATLKTDKTTEAGKLENQLVAELRYQLAEKGYYAYRCMASRADVTGPALDGITPAELKEPLGVEPDFVLNCEIEDGKFLGLQALLMRAALYDLKERRRVWEWKEEDNNMPPVVQWGLLEQLTSPKKKWSSEDFSSSDAPGHMKEGVSKAVKKAAKKLPPVPGHEKLKI